MQPFSYCWPLILPLFSGQKRTVNTFDLFYYIVERPIAKVRLLYITYKYLGLESKGAHGVQKLNGTTY